MLYWGYGNTPFTIYRVTIIFLTLPVFKYKFRKREIASINKRNFGICRKTTTGAVALHYEKLRFFGAFGLTVRELSRKRHTFKGAFSKHRVLSRFSRLASFKSKENFADNGARIIWMLFKKHREGLGKNRCYGTLSFYTPKFGFGLSFKLNLAKLY